MYLRTLLLLLVIPCLSHAHERYGFDGDENASKCIVRGLPESECVSPPMKWSRAVDKFLESQILYFFPSDDKMCDETTPTERLERFNKSEGDYSRFLSSYCNEIIPRQYGGGDNPHAYCMQEETINRKKYLLDKLESNFYIDYCHSIEGKNNTVYLKTNKFIIKITKSCKDNFYLCNDISYLGKRRSDGAEIKLKGGYFLEDGVHAGFEFPKNSLAYRVYFNGALEVREKGNVIFSDTGEWYLFCPECG